VLHLLHRQADKNLLYAQAGAVQFVLKHWHVDGRSNLPVLHHSA